MVIAQNTQTLDVVSPVSLPVLASQLHSVLTDLPVAAVKIGAVGSQAAARTLAEMLRGHESVPVILDPVLAASAGASLHFDPAPGFLEPLMEHTTLLTPNWPEALTLAGCEAGSSPEPVVLAEKLIAHGWRAVLLKAGHMKYATECADFLLAGTEQISFRASRQLLDRAPRGTGCLLSSAVATYMARGLPLALACSTAIQLVRNALASGRLDVGRGAPVLQLTSLSRAQHVPH